MCMITDAILTIFEVWTDEAAKVSKYILRFLATGFLYKKYRDARRMISVKLVDGHLESSIIDVWQSSKCPYAHTLYRSSHQRCSIKKAVLINFAKFTGKPVCQSLFFPILDLQLY